MTGIIPFIDSNHNLYSDGADRAIMGFLMGGLEALETVPVHYDDFNYIGVFSAG